jgi:hypothetical protein
MALTEQERFLLKDLAAHPEGRCLKYPTHPVVKDLAKRGYVALSRALSGPLGIPTGEEWAKISEAGEAAIKESAS